MVQFVILLCATMTCTYLPTYLPTYLGDELDLGKYLTQSYNEKKGKHKMCGWFNWQAHCMPWLELTYLTRRRAGLRYVPDPILYQKHK